MATARQIIERVQASVEDPENKFFTTADYVRAYNDALDEISEITEINESYVYVKRRKDALYADLRGILPPTFLRITSVWNPGSGRWCDPTTTTTLDTTIGRFWERRTDTSRWWFMRGLWFLGSYPVPADDVSPLKIWYTALLPHIKEAGGQTSGLDSSSALPPDYDTAIENYMLYELLAERKEADKSLEFYQRFTSQVQSLKDLAENRMRRDRVPKMGARR